MEAGSGSSAEVKEFIQCFSKLTEKSESSQKLRRDQWNQLDPNGNGYVSLAEFDKWIQHAVIAKCGKTKGERLWRLFRPCYIHAFNKAKNIAPSSSVASTTTASSTTTTTTDDFVSKSEFRLLVAYLCIYSNMLDAFSVIDGGSAGVDANDDRRISKEEWMEGYSRVTSHGFVALADVTDPESDFTAMDADGKGMVLLGEWCNFLGKAEVDAKTPVGELLAVAPAPGK